jgi:chitodextrinase
MNHTNRIVLIFIYCFLSLKSIAQFCTGSLGSPVVNITFGSGSNPGPTLPVAVPGASTTYTYSPNTASDGFYTITNAVPANSAWFTGATDHTGNPNGYMAFFNADPVPSGEFYRQTVTNLCGGTTYEFATWVASVLNINVLPNGISPNITFKILDANSGVVLATSNTGDIPNTGTMIWRQYSLLFTTPLGVNSVVLVLSNNNVGGSSLPGNDLVMDDITFRPCGPTTKASFSSSVPLDSIAITSCSNVNLFGNIIGSFNSPNYQWQMSSDGGNSFSNIGGAVALNSVISGLPNGLYQIRLISSEAGNINSANCSFISNTIKLLISGCTVPVNNTCNNWLRIPNSQSYVTVGDLDVPGTQITVEGLFSRDSTLTPEGYSSLNVVSKHWTPADDNYLLRVDRAQITTSNGAFSTPDICETVNKRVYHVAMTYDGATLKFYRNGFLMSQTPCTGTMFQNNYPTTIAATANSPTTNTQLIGYLNEIRIWNVVKTQAQLRATMNGPLPNPTTQPGLLGYYTFENLLNKQGNSTYNAILHGAASINQAIPNCSLVVDSCRINPNVSGIDSIINSYTPVLAFNPCDNKITVEDASTFNIGDTVLIIQMKGAEIDSSNNATFGDIINYKNAGNYEFNYVKSKTGNIVELKNSLSRGYDVPNGKVQLIRVPYFNNVTVTNTLTCLPWDGRKGGVLVFKVEDSLSLQADIDVSNKGFNGGKGTVFFGGTFNCFLNGYYMPFNYDSSGMKGESITSLSMLKMYAKGKNAGGGGGGMNHNGGGGGGANGGAGGNGGYPHINCSNRTTNFSFGGTTLSYTNTANKAYLGSGGGAANANNGSDASGANGGGLVIISSKYLLGNSKSIISNGGNAIRCNTAGNPNLSPCHDGGGGGGAGGSVLLDIPNIINATNINVNGGNGADLTYLGGSSAGLGPLGPGAGGGGGVVWVKNITVDPALTVSNAGGVNGVILNDGNIPWGANPGLPGIKVTSLSLPVDGPLFKPNIDSTRIADTLRSCRNYTFNGKAFTNIAGIQSWQWTFGDNTSGNTQNTTHTYGASGTYNVKLIVTDINGCKDSVQKQIVVPACPLSTSSIINTYTPVIRLNSCENIISVEDASTFNIGDTVLMIQMKGADIDSTNTSAFGNVLNYKSAGNYEYNYIKGKVGNQIELLNTITRTYEIPTGKVQLIRIPFFQNYTVTDTLTCLPWDGKVGGVLVFNVGNTLTLNNAIDVSGRGFRGGRGKNSFSTTLNCFDNDFSYPANSIIAADKGESIYAIGFNNAYGKGPNANGGGGGLGHNSGGGGGSNGGIGGFGGYQLEACGSSPYDNRGIGGKVLSYTNAANKIFMGGGGGSGHTDNAGGIDMNGGNGGGIVIINTNTINNNGHKIISDGADGQKCNNALNNCHDGGGGGGAAGTVLIKTNTYNNNTTIQTIGGKGADLVIFNASIGAGRIGNGGGGGGGAVWLSQNSLPVNVTSNNTGGANGVILQDFNNAWGATPGQLGQTIFNLNLPITTVPFKKNIDSVKISIISSSCLTFNFSGVGFTNTTAINTWEWNFGDNTIGVGQNVSHTFTAGNNYTVKLVVTDINGCKDSVSLPVIARVCNTPQIINEYTPIVSFDKCKNSITVEDASKYNVATPC